MSGTRRVTGALGDDTLDEPTGAAVEAHRTAPSALAAYWPFVHPVRPNSWRASAIQQPPPA